MRFYFDKRVLLGFLTAFAIIIWLGVNAFLNSKKFAETSGLVAHTNEVLFQAEQLLSNVIDLETSQRGFVLTNDSAFLRPINLQQDVLSTHLDKLHYLTKDNTSQQSRVLELRALVTEKIIFIKHVVEARKINFELARDSILSKRGSVLMDKIKSVIDDIKQEERELLQHRIKLTERSIENFNYTFSSLLATSAVILITIFIALYLSLKARTEYENSLRLASNQIADLYENAPCGYYSIDGNGVFVNINKTMLRWLGYEKDQVVGTKNIKDIIAVHMLDVFECNFPIFKEQGAINNLEFEFVRKDGTSFCVILNSTAITDENKKFVKSRSVVVDITETKKAHNKIKQLNEELEAFSYSVSHDLRSPLRAIDGYTKILEEEYGTKLDAEGNRLMQTIMRNTKRMGQLIDDLLNFSRIGRKELLMTSFDTEKLVKSVIAELLEFNPGRQVKFNILPLEKTFGDSAMIRQVWENLISNALKYTRKMEQSIIEIGSYAEQTDIGFYIKDNGVGFDMTYSNKLFGVFQRLHKIQDFEGTGVGLAIVYRVITRHGGRVWADSKVNEGATFTFTLPSPSNTQ